jgi:anti-sigma factor RsiW
MTCPWRVNVGVYLVGAIAPDERGPMEAHLAKCAECQWELNDLAPIVDFLAVAAPGPYP